MLEEQYRKQLKPVRGKYWMFICYKLRGELVYHIHCDDWRKFIYSDGKFKTSGKASSPLPQAVQKQFLNEIQGGN